MYLKQIREMLILVKKNPVLPMALKKLNVFSLNNF